MSGDIRSIRQFLAVETDLSTTEPVRSDEFIQNNMTLVMLAARHGQLLQVVFILYCFVTITDATSTVTKLQLQVPAL